MPDVVFSPLVDYGLILSKLKEEFDKRWRYNVSSDENGLDNYIIMAALGSGSFGKVHLVKKRDEDQYYAAKQLSKEQIIKTKQVPHVISEKKVLYSVRFPYCVSLIESTKDFDSLYLILPFVSGGELFNYHRKVRKFNEKQARFYAAQIFLALEYLHYCSLLYRDLKPENIMIDKSGYLKMTDFGFAKKVESRTNTLCGTPEYLPPEIIQSKPYGTSVDWWAFGVLIFEFVSGYSPFSAHNRDVMLMYNKICDGLYKMPPSFSPPLKNLITNLLQVDLSKRYGNLVNGTKDIKEHEWFKEIDWIGLLNQQVHPPYTPTVSSPSDISNFDRAPDFKIKVKSKANRYENEFANF